MPKEREFEKRINKLYRMKIFDIYFYGYVEGIIRTLPSIQIKQAVKMFLDEHDIGEDDFSFDTAVQVYYKVRDEADILGKKEREKEEKKE